MRKLLLAASAIALIGAAAPAFAGDIGLQGTWMGEPTTQRTYAPQTANVELNNIHVGTVLTSTSAAVGNDLSITANGFAVSSLTQGNNTSQTATTDLHADILSGAANVTSQAVGNTASVVANGLVSIVPQSTESQTNVGPQSASLTISDTSAHWLNASALSVGNDLSARSNFGDVRLGDTAYYLAPVVTQTNSAGGNQTSTFFSNDDLVVATDATFGSQSVGNNLNAFAQNNITTNTALQGNFAKQVATTTLGDAVVYGNGFGSAVAVGNAINLEGNNIQVGLSQNGANSQLANLTVMNTTIGGALTVGATSVGNAITLNTH